MIPVIRGFSGSPDVLFPEYKPRYTAEISKLEISSEMLEDATPITYPYQDKHGRTLQLWKVNDDFIGTVHDVNGIIIIPGHYICNSLQQQEKNTEFLQRIESGKLTHWSLVYQEDKNRIIVWPVLKAAGKDNKDWTPPAFSENRSQLGHIFKNEKGHLRHDTPQSREAILQATKDPKNYKGTDITGNDIYLKKNPDGTQSWAMVRNGVIRNAGVNSQYAPSKFNPIKQTLQKFDSGGRVKPQSGGTPATRQFQQAVQTAKLTATYNTSHKQNPITEKGVRIGSIGGVACCSSYIEGLFDTPESLFETEHYFCMPALPDGGMPFSDAELGQILRELATGIFVHGQVPFFSLHFNEESNLYPIVHPVYQNTLVGRVISMLDYIMKGYLNGGIFTEEFIDAWDKNPSWNAHGQTALNSMISFTEYCAQHGIEYNSLHVLQKMLNLSEFAQIDGLDDAKDLLVLCETKGFRNSFRIIAKQNSYVKEGGLFVLDSDFDVLYTIEPPPDYEIALERYVKHFGKLPDAYTKMHQLFEEFCQNIHDDMVKLPICRNYFAMLSVINFLTSYFTTQKKHQKIPILSSKQTLHVKGVPRVFPHLPINDPVEKLNYNVGDLFKKLLSNHQNLVTDFIRKFHRAHFNRQPAQLEKEKNDLLEVIEGIINQLILENTRSTRFVEPALKTDKNVQEAIKRKAHNDFIDLETKLKQHLAQFKPNVCKAMLLSAAEGGVRNFLQNLFVEQKDKIEECLAHVEQDFINGSHLHAQEYMALDAIITKSSMWSFVTGLQFANAGGTQKYAKHLVSISQKMLRSLPERLLQSLSTIFEDSTVTVYSLEIKELRIYTEIRPNEIASREKVVGGCGMSLITQAVRTSELAQSLLKKHEADFRKIPVESWSRISYGPQNANGYVFRLEFQDVPEGVLDSFDWMQNELLLPAGIEPSQIEERILIEETMQTAQKEAFAEGVKKAQSLKMHPSLMHQAASINDPYYIQQLAENGLSLEVRDANGYQPVHFAAMNGAVLVLEYLMQKLGKKVLDSQSYNYSNALSVAVLHENLVAVQFLLKHEVSFVRTLDDYTVIHASIHQGNMQIIDAILASPEAQRYINAVSREGGTPLMLACELDSEDLVKKMIVLGASPQTVRWDGVTCLEIALSRRYTPVIKLLLNHADVTNQVIETLAITGTEECAKLLILKPSVFAFRSVALEDTALHIAIKYGNTQVAYVLIANCPTTAYLEHINGEGKSALLLAASLGIKSVVHALTEKLSLTKVALKAVAKSLLVHDAALMVKNLLSQCDVTQDELLEYASIANRVQNRPMIDQALIPLGLNTEAPDPVMPKTDSIGDDALLKAALDGNMEQVKQLIKMGANPNAYDSNLITPLAAVIGMSGSIAVVRTLLQLGADPNLGVTQERLVPLFIAVEQDRPDYIHELLIHGARAYSASGPRGITLLHQAVMANKPNYIKLLIAVGVSPDVADTSGMLPIHHAAAIGSIECLQALIAERPSMVNEIVESFRPNPDKAEAVLKGATALHIAASHNQSGAVDFLLRNKVNVTATTELQKDNVISFAALRASQTLMQQFMRYKIAHDPITFEKALANGIMGDNVDVVANIYTRAMALDLQVVSSFTGLHLASIHGALQVTQWLLEQGANPTICDDKGDDALVHAARNNNLQQFRLLLEHETPDFEALKNDKESLLHIASRHGKVGHILLLLKNGAMLNVQDSRGRLPIHVAVENAQQKVIELLLACGSPHTAKTKAGKSLTDLVPTGFEHVLPFLVSCLAWCEDSVRARDTPLQRAVRSKNQYAVQLMTYLHESNARG